MKNLHYFLYFLFVLIACNSNEPAQIVTKEQVKVDSLTRIVANAQTIIAKKEVPILCYHQIRDHRSTDSKMARDYIVEVNTFHDQMKALSDSGYTTISPEQL